MKPGNRLPLLVAIAIVVAVVAATMLVRGGRGPANDDAGTAPVASDLQAPAPGARAPVAARPAPTRLQGQAIDGAVLDRVEERSRKREELRAQTAALKEQSAQRFASEQVDPTWAPAKVTELDGIAADPAFTDAGVVPTNLDIDCRSSMCRINGQFDDPGKAEDWIMLYTASVGGALPNTVISRTRNPDGTMRVEIYGRGR